MNKDILIEKIKYLSSLPHSSLVEHCIYLENENDNYKAEKYITDFISENSIICEKNKEIERLNNIINKAIEYINENKHLSMFADCREPEEDWNYDLEINPRELLKILKGE